MKKQKFFALIFTFLMLAFAIINAHADNDLSDDIAAGEAQLIRSLSRRKARSPTSMKP